MSLLILLLGFFLVAVLIVDVFGTTLTPRRFQFLSWGLARLIWRGFVFVSDRLGLPVIREHAGPVIVGAILAFWICGTWAVWTVVFLAEPHAVLHATTGEPATFWERVYYVGHALSTLGLGDYQAGSDLWRLLTVVVSFAGLTIVTLTISNLFSFVVGLSETRALAGQLTSLGESGADILIAGWNGRDFSALLPQLESLLTRLFLHAERAEASPVTNHFVHLERKRAIAPAVAALDDAVMLLRHVADPSARPHDLLLGQLCRATDAVVPNDSLEGEAPWPAAAAIPRLQAAGIPVAAGAAASAPTAEDRLRRARIAGWLRETGWTWETRPQLVTGRRDRRRAADHAVGSGHAGP